MAADEEERKKAGDGKSSMWIKCREPRRGTVQREEDRDSEKAPPKAYTGNDRSTGEGTLEAGPPATHFLSLGVAAADASELRGELTGRSKVYYKTWTSAVGRFRLLVSFFYILLGSWFGGLVVLVVLVALFLRFLQRAAHHKSVLHFIQHAPTSSIESNRIEPEAAGSRQPVVRTTETGQ